MTDAPFPGSPQAVAQGCTCPVMDNNNGRGLCELDGMPVYWVNAGCPLHDKPEES